MKALNNFMLVVGWFVMVTAILGALGCFDLYVTIGHAGQASASRPQ